jgi:predicted dinucleotide-binding enzyme
MRIAILGTGRVGSTVGAGLIRAGHSVVFGSRAPEAKGGLPAPSLPIREAVDGVDVVFVAVPGSVSLGVLAEIGQDALAGVVLVDVGNDLTERFELAFPNGSLGATIQAEFPSSRVVKSLNTVSAPLMADPGRIAPTTVFLSGDDGEAKAIVAGLLSDLGWPEDSRIDLGGIATARGPEHYIFLSMLIAQKLQTTSYGIAVVR